MEKTYYITKEQFIATTEAWKKTESHSSWQHIIYNILRSKPADNGFVVRTKNIQANDPWYGYNHAVFEAKWYLKRINFKEVFGIDMPEGLESKLEGIRK